VKILLFANTDWYLQHYRLPLAEALRQRGNEVVLVSPPGPYSHLMEADGFRWVDFDFSRQGKNPTSELRTLLGLWKLYRAERPDVVHHFTIKCVIYGSLAARTLGISHIINALPGLGHVFIDQGWQGKILRFFVKILYRAALHDSVAVFQNPDDQALFVQEGLVRQGRHRLILGSGVDIQRLPAMEENEGTPVVILMARLLWTKGVREFVEAGEKLRKSGLAVRFALVGDTDVSNPKGVPREKLMVWQEQGLVEWWGWREDLVEVFRQAHIVCLPTYYGEGVPRTLLEAASCTKPLIASDMPGCREIVRHGENGLLVPPQDVDALAEAVKILIEDAGLRRRMGLRGREIAAAEFSSERVIDDTLAIYEMFV
jgi:glycosyltransferase involved in cell wall biosynthesis